MEQLVPCSHSLSKRKEMPMTLSAHNERGGSVASVQLGEERKSVETLFDSNLEDVPMVYTVADGMAVSVNQMPELTVVPFGVTYNSDETVEVEISGIETIGSELYVFDAMTGESTAVSEGESISIQPNDYGRYYLTRSSTIGNMNEGVTNGIIISVRGGVVTVTASESLGQVHAVSVSGASVWQDTDCGTNAQFQLRQGTYIIEVDGQAGRKTQKILVR